MYTLDQLLCVLLLLLLSRFSRVQLCATPQTAAHQASRPWDSPGKNTGVGCHFLLQCMKVKSESEVAQSCPTLRDPMDWSLPGSSVHGIFQARVLEWGAVAFSVYVCRLKQSRVRCEKKKKLKIQGLSLKLHNRKQTFVLIRKHSVLYQCKKLCPNWELFPPLASKFCFLTNRRKFFIPQTAGGQGSKSTGKATWKSGSKQSFLIGHELVKWICNILPGFPQTNNRERPWAKCKQKASVGRHLSLTEQNFEQL